MVKGRRKKPGRRKGFKHSAATKAKIARRVRAAWKAGRYGKRKRAKGKRAERSR